MAVSKKMLEFTRKGSWIRRMFEEGARLKAEYGADNVYDFSIGNPDVPPPAEFNQALRELAADTLPGAHSYMPNSGYLSVREAVAAQLTKEQGVQLLNQHVLMTCGAAGALNVVLKALLDPGDEVILLAPYFVEYHFYVDNHGGICRIIPTNNDFSLDLAAIAAAISKKTKAIIINSPNNPTGQIYSADELSGLADLLEQAGKRFGAPVYLISDEPYRKITYDGHVVPSIFQVYANSILASSYSKDLSLPGERIGYIAVHPGIKELTPLLEALTLANRILGFVNAPALMQKVVARLQGVTIDTSMYTRRRELFCALLSTSGYDFVRPKGAFYIFPRSPIDDDVKFVALLQKQRILAVPGRGFGKEGHFRLAFCVDDQVIRKSADGFRKAIDMVTRRGQ